MLELRWAPLGGNGLTLIKTGRQLDCDPAVGGLDISGHILMGNCWPGGFILQNFFFVHPKLNTTFLIQNLWTTKRD
jgi:hypothetical protein